MDLTNEDVADILALLDSLPYDSLDIETPRFRLTLRRAPGGGWTEESQVTSEPSLMNPPGPSAPFAVTPGTPHSPGGTGRAGTAAAAGSENAGHAAGESQAAGAGQVDGPDAVPGLDGLAVVTAPLPGTFYRAPRPGAEPFVQVGDAVTADTVVAIVETMKLMNSVHAGAAGRVARICVGNGEFASLGTTLMLIEPGA
jgi:acetyl-CoA carboxylase biotin carboxyl carrier protein